MEKMERGKSQTGKGNGKETYPPKQDSVNTVIDEHESVPVIVDILTDEEFTLVAPGAVNPFGTSPATGKDEMNLAEFPFALLAKRAGEGQKTIEVVQEGRDHEGRPIRQEWLVTGSDRFGLPVAADDEVYVALMKLLRDNGFTDRTVHFSIAQLLRIMQSGTSKRDYERVIASLDRLSGVLLRSHNAFWDHARRRYVTEAFHLLEGFRIAHGDAGRSGELSSVTFSQFLFGSIQAGFVKNLDVDFYFTLSSPLARRFYRLLDKHRYRARVYEIELRRLAAKLPLQDRYDSQLQRRLDPVFAEFIERGFLESAGYRRGAEGATVVTIRFAPPALETSKPSALVKAGDDSPGLSDTGNAVSATQIPVTESEKDQAQALREKLIAAGVSKTAAATLVRRYDPEVIERQLSYLPQLAGIKNPGGYLRLAIENDYASPQTRAEAKTSSSLSTTDTKKSSATPEAVTAPLLSLFDESVNSGDETASLDRWISLSESERNALLARAEARLRSENSACRGMRKIPSPMLAAKARQLLAEERVDKV